MTTTHAMRAVILGAGPAAPVYLDLVHSLRDLELVTHLRRSAGRTSEVSLFELADKLIQREGAPDVAIFAEGASERGHARLRPEIATILLQAGSDLLIEPPVALTTPDANRIEDTAERCGRTILTAGPFRFARALERAREVIETGWIGRLEAVVASPPEKTSLCSADVTGGPGGRGLWFERAVLALDLLEGLAGETTRVRFQVGDPQRSPDVQDHAWLETDHAGGCDGGVELGWSAPTNAPLARCIGDRGELWVGESQVVLRADRRTEVLGTGIDAVDGRKRALLELLSRRRSADFVPDHGASVVDFIGRAYERRATDYWELA